MPRPEPQRFMICWTDSDAEMAATLDQIAACGSEYPVVIHRGVHGEFVIRDKPLGWWGGLAEKFRADSARRAR